MIAVDMTSSCCYSIYNSCYKQFCYVQQNPLVTTYLVCSVFQSSFLSCHAFVGYNYKFGFSFVGDYSSVDFSLVRLIKEIRDRFFVGQALTFPLNCITHSASYGNNKFPYKAPICIKGVQ